MRRQQATHVSEMRVHAELLRLIAHALRTENPSETLEAAAEALVKASNG